MTIQDKSPSENLLDKLKGDNERKNELPHEVEDKDLVDQMENEPENIEGETKSDKFVRLARARHRKAVKTIRLLGNLGNRTNYEYDDEQVHLMFVNLRSELEEAEKKYSSKEEDEDIFDPFAPETH